MKSHASSISSGQSAFPNQLDFELMSTDQQFGSGQSAFPNQLDWLCVNPLIYQGVFRFRRFKNHDEQSKKIELVRRFIDGLLYAAAKIENPFILLISEL